MYFDADHRCLKFNYEIFSFTADFKKKTDLFKRSPKEFLDAFESTRDEMRADEETFIILHLLKKNESNSPILDGDLEQLALLACCSSPHVVKRALDALLNEIFLSISDFSRIRCRNMLQAEKIIRESCRKSLKVEHLKAKCQRMTTYAWLITFVLLKCSGENFADIATDMKQLDRTLEGLLKENNKQNTFRYGIVLARESIKRILLSCRKKVSNESLQSNIERCDSFMHSELKKEEVTTFGKTLFDQGSWLDLHICLVFLQDLPKVDLDMVLCLNTFNVHEIDFTRLRLGKHQGSRENKIRYFSREQTLSV